MALIVCDAAGQFEMQLKTTLDTLRGLGFSAPYLVVLNKCDLAPDIFFPHEAVRISAKTGAGFDTLKERIFSALESGFVRAVLFVPYAKMAEYGALRALLTEQTVEYAEGGARISAVIPAEHAAKFREYMI